MVSTAKDMGVDADTYRNLCSVLHPEFLQDGDVIDIDPHTQIHRLFNFLDGDAIGGVENVLRWKP